MVWATQNWKSLGHVFCADGNKDWMHTHASYPTPIVQGNGNVQVLFSPRDKDGKSHIAAMDIVLSGEKYEVCGISETPILSPGTRGAFDDAGVTIGSAVKTSGGFDLYYLGWSLSQSVPFTNFIGLAHWDGSGQAKRHSKAPVIGRSDIDPYSVGYPWVMEEGGQKHIWYGSHNFWGPQGLEMEHVIRHGTSKDGIIWDIDNKPAIDVAGGNEFAVSRPCVIQAYGGYHMWYARRFEQYKPGYAFSKDLKNWQRNDEAFSLDNRSDWDCDAITYMSVFSIGENFYMLYNGNGYGRTGFGLAILEE